MCTLHNNHIRLSPSDDGTDLHLLVRGKTNAMYIHRQYVSHNEVKLQLAIGAKWFLMCTFTVEESLIECAQVLTYRIKIA